jgi:Tfp pilus assembly protein PilN
MRINLNLSTRPLENHRRFIAGAGLLAFVGLAALLILSQKVYATWSANRAVRADISRIQREINQSEARQQQFARYFDTPDAKQVLDRSGFLNSLIEERSFPWPKIFEDLEQTLPSGVRIVNIAPRLQGGRAQVKLTIAAMDDESKVKFIRALEASKVFSDVHVRDEKYLEQTQGRGGVTISDDKITVTLDATYSTI